MTIQQRTAVTMPLILLACLLGTAGASGDAVDDYVEKQRQQHNVPGISVAVVRDGKLTKAGGYGLADIELNVPASEHTVYQWASVTKQFTATAVMLLAHEGRVSLGDSVAKYYEKSPPRWSNVTIRHLLTHTAGIPSYTDLPNFFETARQDYEPDELLGLVLELPLQFEPGERWHYNNSAYFLLGLVIEKASGKTYGQFLEERIFRPLGMNTARVNHQFELIRHRATGYANRSNGTTRAEFVSPSQPYAAGALVGTVLDLAKWDAALYTDKLLPASVLEEMWTPVKLSNGQTQPYGYGWQLGDLRGHRCVGHGGGIFGFSTYILRLLEDKLTVIVLCNGGADPQALARGIATRTLPELSLASITPQTDPDPSFSRSLEQCLRQMGETRDCELLTAEFRKNFSRSQRRYAALREALQDVTAFTFLKSEPPRQPETKILNVPVARFATYKLALAQGEPRYYRFAITEDQKLAGFELEE